MNWLNHLAEFWPHLAAGFSFLAALLASAHALLHKRDSRAAVLWVGFIWLLPLLGAALYATLGVNRIRRRALALGVSQVPEAAGPRTIPEDMGEPHRLEAEHLRMLAHVVDRVAARPLVAGNRVQSLVNGDEAFPAMVGAIDAAAKSVSLATYIFDNDPSGRQFVAALGRAVGRGVQVRVLIDDAGARYSWPPVVHQLKHAHVPVARFLPTLAPWHLIHMNLRNHRKIMVVDGQVGFTGGMNIRHGNVLAGHPRSPVQDLHFRIEGPLVAQLQEAFANDWAYCTNELLAGLAWFPELSPDGSVIARVITDGPDQDFEKARWTLLGALSCAQTSVQILTPYFLPEQALITALNLVALRGVEVDIILPGKSNLRFVDWASRAMWWQVLEHGCRIWLTPPPFDHSKLTVVDGCWALLGSANWDPRSLRLNFEYNLECYDADLAQRLEQVVIGKLKGADLVTLEEVDNRPLAMRLGDGIARLLTPYL